MTTAFRDVVAVEARKASRHPAAPILLVILVAYVALLVLALSSVLRTPGFDTGGLLAPLREDAVGFVVGIAGSIATILLLVFAAQVAGQEFSRGTLRTMLLGGARRMHLAWAKLLVLGVAALVLAALCVLAGVAGAWAFAGATGEPLLRADARSLAGLFLRTAAALAAWGALSCGATLATRSLGFGIGATLVTLVGGDAIGGVLRGLGDLGVWASRALPNAGIDALTTAHDAATWAWVVPNLAFYVGGTVLVALSRLRRMDAIAATK